MYFAFKKYTNPKEWIPFWLNIVIVLIFIIIYPITRPLPWWIHAICYIILVISMALMILSTTDNIQSTDFKDKKQAMLLLPLLEFVNMVGIGSAFSMIPAESIINAFVIGIIVTMILVGSCFVHFWRLINMSQNIPIIIIAGISTILALEFALYLGLGITVSPEKLRGTSPIGDGVFDNIVLLINMGVGSVVQFPGIENGQVSSTRMTVAYCVGNMINFIVASFAIAYVVSMISDIKRKRDL